MIYILSKLLKIMKSIPRYGQTYAVRLHDNKITTGMVTGATDKGFVVETADGTTHTLDFFKFLGPQEEKSLGISENQCFLEKKTVNCY